MFYYIIHNLPIWTDLPNGKRNVRTFLLGTVCYILLHALLFSKIGEEKHYIKLFRNYIYYLWAADAIAMAVIYKQFYKKSILSEVGNMIEDVKPSKPVQPAVKQMPTQTAKQIPLVNAVSVPTVVAAEESVKESISESVEEESEESSDESSEVEADERSSGRSMEKSAERSIKDIEKESTKESADESTDESEEESIPVYHKQE